MNFSIGSILGPEVTIRTLSPRAEKLKFSKCSISNQISREVYLWLLWVLYGLIFSWNTWKFDLVMTQVDFKLFLRLWVWLIQASPNSIRCFTNPWVFSPNSPNIYRQSIQGNFNPINHFFRLILNLPLDSSLCFNMKNNEFQKKTCSNLVFGDDFTSTRTKWMYHDFFYVLRLKFQSKKVNIML